MVTNMSLLLWPLLFALAVTTMLSSASQDHKPFLTAYQPLNTLPSLLASARRPQDAGIIEQNRNTMSLYPFIIDSKDFSSLRFIFAEKIHANYSAPIGVLVGIKNVSEILQASLKNVDTQHLLWTQVIDVHPGGRLARSVTYYRAAHFKKWEVGLSEVAGTGLYAFGYYDDQWQLDERSGFWRIYQRSLTYLGPLVGDTSIFS